MVNEIVGIRSHMMPARRSSLKNERLLSPLIVFRMTSGPASMILATSGFVSGFLLLPRSKKSLKLRPEQEPRFAHEIVRSILIGRIVIEPRHVERQLQVLLARQQKPV